MNIEPIALPNPGLLHTFIEPDLFDDIHYKAIQKFHDRNKEGMQHRLAGQINHEYEIPEVIPHIKPVVVEMARKYAEYFPDVGSEADMSLHDYDFGDNDPPWINFQYKHEYNPTHRHSGEFSFVLWLNVPYTREAEHHVAPGSGSIRQHSGNFLFTYTNILGSIVSYLPVDEPETLRGRLLLFASKLSHCVYPFYSSDYPRVSIAGNLQLVLKNQSS